MSIIIKIIFALSAIAVMAAVYASQPAKTTEEQTVDVFADKYQVIKANSKCQDWCRATLQAGAIRLDLEYNIVNGEVEQIDNVKASLHGEAIPNIYIDRSEYPKIISAVRGSI